MHIQRECWEPSGLYIIYCFATPSRHRRRGGGRRRRRHRCVSSSKSIFQLMLESLVKEKYPHHWLTQLLQEQFYIYYSPVAYSINKRKMRIGNDVVVPRWISTRRAKPLRLVRYVLSTIPSPWVKTTFFLRTLPIYSTLWWWWFNFCALSRVRNRFPLPSIIIARSAGCGREGGRGEINRPKDDDDASNFFAAAANSICFYHFDIRVNIAAAARNNKKRSLNWESTCIFFFFPCDTRKKNPICIAPKKYSKLLYKEKRLKLFDFFSTTGYRLIFFFLFRFLLNSILFSYFNSSTSEESWRESWF